MKRAYIILRGPRSEWQNYEDVYVRRRCRFKIVGRSNSPADGVMRDHAVSLHLVDDLQGGFHKFIVNQPYA